MSTKSKLKRIWMLSLAFLVMLSSIVMAAETRRIDIYLEYKDVTLNVYRIGSYDEVQGNRTAVLAYEVVGSGVDIIRIWKSASEIHDVAEALETYVKANQVEPYRTNLPVAASSEEAGKPGKAVVEDLEDGIYLFIKSGGSARVTITPFILTVPYYDKEAASWLYTMKVYPKCGYISSPGGSSGDGGGDNPPGITTTTITSSDVPLASISADSPLIPIEDSPVPLAGIPKMGDMGVAGYLSAAFVMSAIGLLALGKGRKYKNRDEN